MNYEDKWIEQPQKKRCTSLKRTKQKKSKTWAIGIQFLQYLH